MTLVEGESGVVVIDPLVSKETATAAFALYSKHRGPREGQFGTPTTAASADLLRALTVPQIFDSIAVRVDGPRAWDHHITIAWVFTDEDTTYVTELRNGALNHRPIAAAPTGTTTFRLTRADLVGILTGGQDLHAALADGAVHVEGDPADLGLLVSLLAPVDPNFAIVTP